MIVTVTVTVAVAVAGCWQVGRSVRGLGGDILPGCGRRPSGLDHKAPPYPVEEYAALQEMAELGCVVDGDLRQRERRNGLLTQLHGIAEVIQGQRMDGYTGILHFGLMLGGS